MTRTRPTLAVAVLLLAPGVGRLSEAVASEPGLQARSVVVGAGTHSPFYPPSDALRQVAVPAFGMDATPVTVGQFADFVQREPRWARGAPPSLFADEAYLSRWASTTDPGTLRADLPVTQVSWFAARAYCQDRGGDLPTVHQWEYAADATESAPSGGREDPETLARILAWYGEGPGAALRPVGQQRPNHWGLHDVHGLVWEWTLDCNSQLVSADIREAGEQENLRFCGAGALSARDPQDYASFMRFALRSSLSPSSTTANLGFRCAYPL